MALCEASCPVQNAAHDSFDQAIEPSAEVLEKQLLAYLPFPCQAIRCSMTSAQLLTALRKLGGCDVVFLSAVWQYLQPEKRGPSLKNLLALTREHLAVRALEADAQAIEQVARQAGFEMTCFSRLNPTNNPGHKENLTFVYSRRTAIKAEKASAS